MFLEDKMFGGAKKEKREKKSKKTKDVSEDGSDNENPVSSPKEQPKATTTAPAPTANAEAEKLRQQEEDRKRKEAEEKKKADEKKKQEEKEAKEREAKANEAKKATPASPTPSKSDKAHASEDSSSELASLDGIKVEQNEVAFFRQLFDFAPAEVFGSFDQLQTFSRDLNAQMSTPEVVILGKKGQGKSSVLEALLGFPLPLLGPTKRPVHIHLLNNPAAAAPKITIKRDAVIKEHGTDVEVKLLDLAAEIGKRNKFATEEPVLVQFEHKNIINLTIIDTPAVLDEDDGEVSRENRDSLLFQLAKPTHRILVSVESAHEPNRSEMMAFIKKVDPELTRTAFVHTRFFNLLQSFTSTREVNKYLSSTLPDVKSFFVTLLSDSIKTKHAEPQHFQTKLAQAFKRDMQSLEQLQYDKRFESNIGILGLRKFVVAQTWRSYQEAIPRVLKHLRTRRTEQEKKVKTTEETLSSLDSSKLRLVASNYVVSFLQIVDKLISGTSEGSPVVNGQTLEEEKSANPDGEWVDMYHHVIRFEPEEWGVPYWDKKLYGGQQFERLLAEFKAVADKTDMPELTMDDVATAAGINKLNNIPNYAWAASDLAQQKSQDAFVPLIEQLTNRAVFIVKRLTEISDKIMEQRKKKFMEEINASFSPNSSPFLNFNSMGNFYEEIERYPFFIYHVKDLFNKFIERAAKICKEKCMDEFYSTKTIYWDLTSEYADRNLPLERNDQDDVKQAVVSLSTKLFAELRDRITKNVLLKFYNFFLVPMQSELWNEIQGKVTCLSDTNLEGIFEVVSTKDKLKVNIKSMQDDITKLAEQEKVFLQHSSAFSKTGGDL